MREHQKRSEQNAFILDKLHRAGIVNNSDLVDAFPGIIHLNSKTDLQLTLLNDEAVRLFGRSSDEIREIGTDFFEEYVHPETVERAFPHFLEFYQANDTEAICGEFQCVKLEDQWTWVYTCAKIQKDGDCFLSVSVPMLNLGKSSEKLERLLGEHLFVRKNFERFQSLTKQEKNVLTRIAEGLTNKEIGEELYISKETVKTHRKRIKRKLEAKRLADLIRYALAFGLIE